MVVAAAAAAAAVVVVVVVVATAILAQNRELGFPEATVSDLKTSLLKTKFFEDCPATSLREVLLQSGLNQGTWRIIQSQRF